MNLHGTPPRIKQPTSPALRACVAAALATGLLVLNSAFAQQPPPPCHPNPNAEEDREQLQSLNRELTHLSLSVRLVSEESKSLIASISRDLADPRLGDRDGFILRWFFADLLDALRDKAEDKSLANGS